MADDRTRGLYDKYHVERLNDPLGKHKDCSYFVLNLVHDKYAADALEAYALACRHEFDSLSRDLIPLAERIRREHNHDPLTPPPAGLCAHCWVSNSGNGGEPEFRLNRHMSTEPLMHVMCSKCGSRTWFTEKRWKELPR